MVTIRHVVGHGAMTQGSLGINKPEIINGRFHCLLSLVFPKAPRRLPIPQKPQLTTASNMRSEDRLSITSQGTSTDIQPLSKDIVPAKRAMLERVSIVTTSWDTSSSKSSLILVALVTKSQTNALQTLSSDDDERGRGTRLQ